MNFFPLHDRVLVRTDKNPEKSTGGIFFPDAYTNEAISKPNTGTVVAVGKGITYVSTGQFIPTTLKVGEKVVFDRNAGTDAKELGEGLRVLSEKDVLAVISEE